MCFFSNATNTNGVMIVIDIIDIMMLLAIFRGR